MFITWRFYRRIKVYYNLSVVYVVLTFSSVMITLYPPRLITEIWKHHLKSLKNNPGVQMIRQVVQHFWIKMSKNNWTFVTYFVELYTWTIQNVSNCVQTREILIKFKFKGSSGERYSSESEVRESVSVIVTWLKLSNIINWHLWSFTNKDNSHDSTLLHGVIKLHLCFSMLWPRDRKYKVWLNLFGRENEGTETNSQNCQVDL